jgi:hypothetical protein
VTRRTGILTAVIAIAVGVIAVGTAPNGTAIVEAFAVRGAPGDVVRSRLLEARVLDVRAGDLLTVPEVYGDEGELTTIATVGVWIVVDVELTSRAGRITVEESELQVGGVIYRTSVAAPDAALLTLPYGAGVPMRGSIAFEVPEEVLGAGTAQLVLRTRIDDRLDDVPVVAVPLPGATEGEVRIEAPVVVSPEERR